LRGLPAVLDLPTAPDGVNERIVFEEIISVPLVIDDVSLTPRTAVLGHLSSDVTQSKSKPLVPGRKDLYMARGPITGAYMHATHPAERRRLASGLLRLPQNSK